jgi:acyl-CoA thioester hydrolase
MEGMVLHVALAGPKSAPFPAAARAKIETLLTAHQTLPIPHEVGRKVGLKQK